jgi:4-amino-4-deoxy-L-arabinose transferase-like glycosyltransferase
MSQAVIGALSALIIYLLGKRMLGQTTGILAGLGIAAYPLLVYMSGEVYPETLFVFLLSLILFSAFRVSTPRPEGIDSRSIVLSGMLLGLTTLCRSNLLTLFPVLTIWPFLNLGVKAALRVVVLMFFVTGLVILPWTIRNYVIFGEFVPLSTQGGGALWQGNNALSAGGGTLANQDTWPNADYPDRGWYGWSGLTEPESSRKFAREAKRWIRENPLSFVALIPQKILRAWSPVSFTTQSSRTAHPLTKIILFPYIPFLLLALYGSLTVFKSWRVILPLYTMPALVTLQAAIYFGGTRYSILMAPALIIFAAAGIESLARHLFRPSGDNGYTDEKARVI